MFCCRKFYVRDGALIGDFRDSLSPMVWRMELARVHAVGFKVQQNGSNWDLGMEAASGFTPIASYSSQQAANKALNGISCSLQRQGWGRRLVQFLLLVLVVAFLASVLYTMASTVGGGGLQQISLPAAPPPVIGQPLSADQALRAPPPAAR